MDWHRILAGEQVASSYCVRKGLIRKAHLAHNLAKWVAKHPEGFLSRSVPQTFILELDDPEYVDEALCDVPEVNFTLLMLHYALDPCQLHSHQQLTRSILHWPILFM